MRRILKEILKYNHSDFTPEGIFRLKDGYKIIPVFSTFGEREADLVCEKIKVLKSLPSGFVDQIVVNHRRSSVDEDRTEMKVKSLHPYVKLFLSSDITVPDMGSEPGKGADMRRTLYRINIDEADEDPEKVIVIFLDADVVPEYFGAYFVTALAGAVLKGADFAKAGFWRKTGRVKKFAAQPLFSIISHDSLKRLSDFSYPLSGEAAGTLKFFNSVSFWQRYGVETGILVDALMGRWTIADVNLGLYDHEHHEDSFIQKMSFGVMRAFFKSLERYGLIAFSAESEISDVLKYSYISSNKERCRVEESCDELCYQPLNSVLVEGIK